MRKLVRLRTRPSRDAKMFKYFLDYKDEKVKGDRFCCAFVLHPISCLKRLDSMCTNLLILQELEHLGP